MLVITCELCKSANLNLILDLGFHPLADSFLKKDELLEPEMTYPLQVLMCQRCGHAMNSFIVPPTTRYQDHDYSYDSSNSKVSIEHFKEMARDVAQRVGVTEDDLVVDIGSSVGTLLQAFKDQTRANILGVEPSHNIAALADKNNVPTIHDFWNDGVTKEVLKVGKAKAITITNAFNHISDLNDFMRNIVATLAPDGALVIEAPYLLHLVQKLAFDTIYLEHVSYFAIKPLVQYFKKYGMVITDILENDYMGGSIRLYVRFGTELCPAVEKNIERENTAQLYDLTTYIDLSQRIQQFKYALVKQLLDARLGGGTVIGIGAPAKGNTLLNYCGIDSTMLDFITDASPLKIGKYTPGSHIPILPDEAITTAVTHALILPWNIAEFLKSKLAPKYPKISFIIPHMQ